MVIIVITPAHTHTPNSTNMSCHLPYKNTIYIHVSLSTHNHTYITLTLLMLHIKLGETPTAPKWRSSVISTICSKKSSAIMMTPALGGGAPWKHVFAELWSIWNEFGTRMINKLVHIKVVYFENWRDISFYVLSIVTLSKIECICTYIWMMWLRFSNYTS